MPKKSVVFNVNNNVRVLRFEMSFCDYSDINIVAGDVCSKVFDGMRLGQCGSIQHV